MGISAVLFFLFCAVPSNKVFLSTRKGKKIMTWKGNRMSRRHATRGKGGGRDSGLAKDPQGKDLQRAGGPPPSATDGREGGRAGEAGKGRFRLLEALADRTGA